MAYIKLYLPDDGSISEQSKEWAIAREVSMLAYGHHMHKAPLLTAEQTRNLIKIYLTPFDTQLTKDWGISATQALEIASSIQERLEQNLSEANRRNLVASSRLGQVTHSEIIRRHGDAGEMFWSSFSVQRGSGKDITYPTEENIIVDRPLLLTSEGIAICYRFNQLLNAIFVKGEQCLSNGDKREAYFRHRDKTLEAQIIPAFKQALGDRAEFYRNVSESPHSDEHDLVILIDNTCLFVEAKASPPKEPFRDPDKAFPRLRDAFGSDTGIQKAFDQANRLYTRFNSREDIL